MTATPKRPFPLSQTTRTPVPARTWSTSLHGHSRNGDGSGPAAALCHLVPDPARTNPGKALFPVPRPPKRCCHRPSRGNSSGTKQCWGAVTPGASGRVRGFPAEASPPASWVQTHPKAKHLAGTLCCQLKPAVKFNPANNKAHRAKWHLSKGILQSAKLTGTGALNCPRDY